MQKCKFCEKECKNDNSLRNHQRLCRDNPERVIPPKTQKWRDAMKSKKASNQHIKAKETGVPYIISEDTRQKMSEANRIRRGPEFWTNERKRKHSRIMHEVVKKNPESYGSSNVCGRVKIEQYKGEKFHGKWEVMVAKWLDKHNIKWIRSSIKPIPYQWGKKYHLYFPDFYLPELDLYIEVKGNEVERDRCKWDAVPNLVVIKLKEIKLIRENKLEASFLNQNS